MHRWVLAVACAAAFTGSISTAGVLPAHAGPSGKPLFSDMKNENDVAVQQVRDALSAFNGANKRWPSDLTALKRFADNNSLPLDLAAFSKANYSVQDKNGASVAVFEFVTKAASVKGAFALANFVVK